MATGKSFSIQAGNAARAVLADAIAQFAHAAYPPGCSDCGQMARDALLTTAKQVVTAESGSVELRSRQRRLLRQAVQWYFDNAEGLDNGQRQRMTTALLTVLDGQQTDETVFKLDR